MRCFALSKRAKGSNWRCIYMLTKAVKNFSINPIQWHGEIVLWTAHVLRVVEDGWCVIHNEGQNAKSDKKKASILSILLHACRAFAPQQGGFFLTLIKFGCWMLVAILIRVITDNQESHELRAHIEIHICRLYARHPQSDEWVRTPPDAPLPWPATSNKIQNQTLLESLMSLKWAKPMESGDRAAAR